MNCGEIKPGDLLFKRNFMNDKIMYYFVVYVNEIDYVAHYAFYDKEIVLLDLVNNSIRTFKADNTWELSSMGYEKI